MTWEGLLIATDPIFVFPNTEAFSSDFIYLFRKTSRFLLWYLIQDCSKHARHVFYFMLFWCRTLLHLHFRSHARPLQCLPTRYLYSTLRSWMIKFPVGFSRIISTIRSLTLCADTGTFHPKKALSNGPHKHGEQMSFLSYIRVKKDERTLKHTSLWLGRKIQRFSGTN